MKDFQEAREPTTPGRQGRAVSSATGRLGAVAAGHPLAVDAALETLRCGGTAMDAAVAAHAVLCVVMPDACGLGGDSLFLVRGEHEVQALNGTGAAAAGAGSAWIADGGASVTVPGSVAAWSEAVTRHGRLGLARVLGPAIEAARYGFAAQPALCEAVAAQRARLLRGGAGGWSVLAARPGERIIQPALAEVLTAVADHGPAAFYLGPVAGAVCEAVVRDGGCLTPADLAAHRTVVREPVAVPWDAGTVHVQPPSSQGVLLAMALQWLENARAPGPDRRPLDQMPLDHLSVELTEAVFGYRDRCARDGAGLLLADLQVDPVKASRRGGPRAYLHTTGVAVADAAGMVVSSLLSVFDDFGAGTFVPECGLVLNNRAAGFTGPPNDPGPGRRPVHTLAPAILEAGGTVTALATPGADGQVQTLLQVLLRLRDGQDLAAAIGAPRWRSEGGNLLVGHEHPALASLRGLGHNVLPTDDGDGRFGAMVSATSGPAGPSAVGDWRRQVATGGM